MDILTLEEAGYRKLCPRNFHKAEGVIATLKKAGYEIVEGSDYVFCKPLGEPKRFVSLAGSLFGENYKTWNEILDSLNFLYRPAFEPTQQTRIKDVDVENLIRAFLDKPMPESLHYLRGLLFWSHPQQLRSVLEIAANAFLQRYPNGRIHFIHISDDLGNMQAIIRVLAAVDDFGVEELERITRENQLPPQILTRIHPVSIEPVVENILKSLHSCFFRFIYGADVARVGGYIILQFDPPVAREPEYTRLRWDFNRLGGIFQPEAEYNAIELLQARKDVRYDEAFHRYIFDMVWTAEEFEQLLRWTIDGINKFWMVVLDLCRYTTQDGFIDFLEQKKTFLTLERILRVSPKGVRVRELTEQRGDWITQKMREHDEGPYTREDFAANLLHEIRNSFHGYLLHGGGFEKFMLMHSGDIPDTLPDLAIVWFFLLLADIEGLLNRDWVRGKK